MIQISKEEAYILPSVNLSDISEEKWPIINKQRNSFIIGDDCESKYFKWPGYIFSSVKAQLAYMKIYQDFIDKSIYTPSHGNLSKNNNYIFLGIRPSHTMPYQRPLNGYPAWFLGSSSEMFQRLLSELNIYPYVGNIYNQPTQPFNKDFTFIFKELIVIMYIYKVIYKINELNIMFMGSYDEYPIFIHQLKTHPLYKQFNMVINTYSMWHPSYLVRSYSDDKFETWKYQVREKSRKI